MIVAISGSCSQEGFNLDGLRITSRNNEFISRCARPDSR